MKRTLIAAALSMLIADVADAQQLPTASPKGQVEQIVGLTNVTVEYNRPSMRERAIFGDLVPFDQVWRTGANKCTTIEFDGPVKIEGNDIGAGKYSIFTIPGNEVWVVIFNKNTELWGEGDRKEEEDVLTVKVNALRCDPTETFTMGFDNVKDDRASLQMRWERTLVSVAIEADATERALANIKEATAKPDADFRVFHASGRFLVDRGLMPEEALRLTQKSVDLDKRFWNLHSLALAYAANGRYKEAIATAQESLAMSEKAEYPAYVKMNQEKIAEWGKAQSAKPADRGGMRGR
ncbi:MAG: DUF2911 domain-containing protein [Flavobacteriales bacterium]|nr:DUF2911 domain-containing protein [Flavobacteriales bacterium]